jgi:hypothetical protein
MNLNIGTSDKKMNTKYKSIIKEIDKIHKIRRELNIRENILQKKISIIKN